MRRLTCALLLAACGDLAPAPVPEPSPVAPERQAILDVKVYVDENVARLVEACEGICAAAPAPDADGWSIEADGDAVDSMRRQWRSARDAYERVEGAIAILFPRLDQDVDGRYEHIVELRPDLAPFDETGFIGMHALERILWAGSHSADVERFERGLRGYGEPRTPAGQEEAARFRDGLCARLVRDATTMQRQLAPLALDHQTAWRGIQGSVEEQAEKVAFHATGEDESRYSQRTLADMRANLAGGRAVLAAYAPMMAANPRASALRDTIEERFAALARAYGSDGDALPPVPDGFDPDGPSADHLATPYGHLFTLLSTASDPREEGSLAHLLRRAGDAMDIPPLARAR